MAEGGGNRSLGSFVSHMALLPAPPWPKHSFQMIWEEYNYLSRQKLKLYSMPKPLDGKILLKNG